MNQTTYPCNGSEHSVNWAILSELYVKCQDLNEQKLSTAEKPRNVSRFMWLNLENILAVSRKTNLEICLAIARIVSSYS